MQTFHRRGGLVADAASMARARRAATPRDVHDSLAYTREEIAWKRLFIVLCSVFSLLFFGFSTAVLLHRILSGSFFPAKDQLMFFVPLQ